MNSAEALERAGDLFNQRQYARSVAVARRCLEEVPNDGRLWQVHGTALWALNEYAAARAALETATSLAPLYPLPQHALADCYVRAGQRELGLTIYRHLVECRRCPSSLLPRVAAALNCLGEHALALQACQTLTDRDPTHHQAFFGTAYYLCKLGAPAAELVAPLALAMDLAPTIVHYRINLAFVWAELGDLSRADFLLRPVAIAGVGSACWLVRMQSIFEALGDEQRRQQCVKRLKQLQHAGRAPSGRG